jgi:hypothetical protein
LGNGVWVLGFGYWGLSIGVWASGFAVQVERVVGNNGVIVQHREPLAYVSGHLHVTGFKIQGLGFRD